MRNQKKTLLLLLTMFAIAAATVLATIRNQPQNDSSYDKKKLEQLGIDDTRYPIADYTAPAPSDPEERALRHARNKRYNVPQVKGGDVSRFMLKEGSEPILLQLEESHPPTEPAIPAAKSDIILIGEVTTARAYLSEDKTNVYSEFTVRAEDVLKNDPATPLSPGASLAVERSGGRVRFPSGKIIFRGGAYGRNMPRVGQRYILFLKRNDEGQTYSITTGYKLSLGRVHPLDGSPKADNKSPRFAAYEGYEGSDEAKFLTELRASIAASDRGGQ